ncbi:hypothetical protein IFM12276_25130 [Nocardia sputorum]|uniref:DUF3558 domain-containing protein n=1 Tax=Nocardia sputorum TaxID=2984338 RepID=A0ABM8CWW7_9NOCA|nr:hypothetical protein IFM12276_25130 [Nocardia sputorum]
MTDPQHAPDNSTPGGFEHTSPRPSSSEGDWTRSDTGFGRIGQGYQPQPVASQGASASDDHRKPVLFAAGVIALVAMLGAGVMIGIIIADGDSGSRSAAVEASAGAPATSSTATVTPRPEPAPGIYSMNGIADACDLVDPAPLHKWSSIPDRPPFHHETPPSADDPGRLSCQFSYKSLAGDGVHWNQAGIDLRVEFTTAGAAPAYDDWKRQDTTPGSGSGSGELTGIGAQGYWHTSVSEFSYTTGMDYLVGVQDSNVSVRVRIPILRQHGEPPVNPDELGAIARNQAKQALDGLRKK